MPYPLSGMASSSSTKAVSEPVRSPFYLLLALTTLGPPRREPHDGTRHVKFTGSYAYEGNVEGTRCWASSQITKPIWHLWKTKGGWGRKGLRLHCTSKSISKANEDSWSHSSLSEGFCLAGMGLHYIPIMPIHWLWAACEEMWPWQSTVLDFRWQQLRLAIDHTPTTGDLGGIFRGCHKNFHGLWYVL